MALCLKCFVLNIFANMDTGFSPTKFLFLQLQLGLSATLGDPFFRSIDPHSVCITLLENIQYMEFRHVKQLVHLALTPLVKFCPSDVWEVWLEKVLHPLLAHASEALSSSWSSLLREGRAKVPDLHGILSGSDLKSWRKVS